MIRRENIPLAGPLVQVGKTVPWCGRVPETLRHAEHLAQQRADELKERVWIMDRKGYVWAVACP